MPVEVQVLGFAALLQYVQFVLMAVPVNLQLGPRYTAGPRDEQRLPAGVGGRLHRALANHSENLILFAIAVIVVVLGEASSPMTEKAAWVYLIARVVYVPAYASGIYMLRSLVFTVGFSATLYMLVSALFW
ncbi:MAG: MAPEG family protein [Congregibacter sp.]